MCVCVCVCVRACARARACVRACEYECACVRACARAEFCFGFVLIQSLLCNGLCAAMCINSYTKPVIFL